MPISKNAQPITTLEDWERLAPPKSAHHWTDDRSAKEVARAWLSASEPAYPTEVQDVISAHPMFGPVLSWECEPEARLRFDSYPGEPRNSDLAIAATDAFGSYVLAVEAKADEPYDKTVADTLATALEYGIENPRSNGVARIQGLSSFIFHPRASSSPKIGMLRYQLLTACAGAAAEAVRRQASRAVMLVHEFITIRTIDANHERNAADLEHFLHRLGNTPIEGFCDGRLYGPFTLPGAPGLELFVGKVTRNLRP